MTDFLQDYWLDLLAVQATLKSLLQHHNSKASILQRSASFIVQLSHPYMTTGKTMALTRWTFVDKVMYLFFNILSRLVVALLPRIKHLLISWLQSPSAVILEPPEIVCLYSPTLKQICFYRFPSGSQSGFFFYRNGSCNLDISVMFYILFCQCHKIKFCLLVQFSFFYVP